MMMSKIVKGVKRILKIGPLDEIDEKTLDEDIILNYTQIINSNKYADSNSNTEALERLILNMDLREEKEPGQVPQEQPVQVSDFNSALAIVQQTSGAQPYGVDQAPNGNQLEPKSASQPDQESGSKAQPIFNGQLKQKFAERLNAHLSLMEELEGESASLLPGQPVYQPAKFGKTGGNHFVLRKFMIPSWVYDAMDSNNVNMLNIASPLTPDIYVKRYQTLLWVEEAHQAIEMRRYDLMGAMIAKYDQSFFLLNVPGLAEGRPSLMRGDRLVLKSDKRSTYYEGYIFEVRERDVKIKLNERLHSTAMDGLRFDVSFLTSRTPYRRCHHAVLQFQEMYSMMQGIVFPVPRSLNDSNLLIDIKESTPEKLRCFTPQLNTYQRQAVMNVLKAECRPAPYIIFGPPGTGKTVTMVEAILQVYARKPNSKILACGNSNSCADLIAKRILDSKEVPENMLVRVMAFYRMEKLVPPEIEEITKDMDMIDADMYSKYRIVVTTCSQSGTLYEFKDKFDYVFIDEAGHASEPEALISISLMHRHGCCVLAGDPHQLGPVCVSNIADQYGLGCSLLERLSRRSVYQRRPINAKMAYDSRYLTKLIISYRSDKRVMEVNNKLFYDNELKYKVETPLFWMRMFSVTHPLVFHSVKGKDLREYTNPSWFNANEAITCLTYVNRLYNSGLKPHQLGIITPYRRQIEKLNLLFESCNLKKCKIATMEEFQGDEREIIIISTVRTKSRNIAFDRRFNLGFLFNPKRFNVAVSRAKWMVIVIGDPQILTGDRCWIEYIRAAHKIGYALESIGEDDAKESETMKDKLNRTKRKDSQQIGNKSDDLR